MLLTFIRTRFKYLHILLHPRGTINSSPLKEPVFLSHLPASAKSKVTCQVTCSSLDVWDQSTRNRPVPERDRTSVAFPHVRKEMVAAGAPLPVPGKLLPDSLSSSSRRYKEATHYSGVQNSDWGQSVASGVSVLRTVSTQGLFFFFFASNFWPGLISWEGHSLACLLPLYIMVTKWMWRFPWDLVFTHCVLFLNLRAHSSACWSQDYD